VQPGDFVPTLDAALGFYTASTQPQIRRALEAAASAAIQYDLELQIVRQDDALRWVRVTGRRADEDGRPQRLCGVIQDITERRALEDEIVAIAQRERTRLGFDLHDGLGQELTGAAMILNGVLTSLPADAATLRDELDKVEALIRDAIGSCRAMAEGAAPTAPERGGLIAAARQLAARIERLHAVRVLVRIRGERWALDDSVADHLYRIIQEAVTNALKHGRAQRIVISLESNAKRTFVSVSNDHHGAAARKGTGMGLKIMQFRAQLVGGRFSIRALPLGGMRVRCCLPNQSR
jgi:signal transduction histidine kinase